MMEKEPVWLRCLIDRAAEAEDVELRRQYVEALLAWFGARLESPKPEQAELVFFEEATS